MIQNLGQKADYGSDKDLKLIIIIIIFCSTAAQHRLYPPRPQGFLITHNDAPQSVGLFWTSDQLVAQTST
jgi:hypothetical protein